MMKAVSLVVPAADSEELVKIVSNFDEVEDVSEPAALEPGSVLNAGIGIEEIKAMLEFVTVILSTATTFLVFLKALREEMKSRKKTVIVTDPASGKKLGEITASTTDEDIQRMAG